MVSVATQLIEMRQRHKRSAFQGLSEVGHILDVKQNACGDGMTGTGNSLVKSPRNRKRGDEASLQPASSRLH
jgi:hypothetical protein